MNLHPKVQKLIDSPQWTQRSSEWYDRRKTLMTASDCAAALGIPAFESFRGDPRAHCIHEKVYGKFKGNMFTKWGCEHEDMVCDRFGEIIGEKVLMFGLLVHPDLPWLGASPDGICERSGVMVEIKCPMRRKIVPGEVPEHYMPQVQVQLEVCDLEACAFVQWQPAHLSYNGQEFFDITIVQRDREWFAKNKDALYSFWEDLMEARANYVPPPPPVCLIRENMYDDM